MSQTVLDVLNIGVQDLHDVRPGLVQRFVPDARGEHLLDVQSLRHGHDALVLTYVAIINKYVTH